MTQLIFYASKDGGLEPAATDKESLSVHTEGGHEASGHVVSDQFRGITKLIVHGKGGESVVKESFTTAADGNRSGIPIGSQNPKQWRPCHG